jgi:thiopurine S-methyltransferase
VETTKIFLLTIEDAAEGDSLSHALGVDDEIKTLFADNFDINLTHVDSIYESDSLHTEQALSRTEYKVYQLNGKEKL